MNLFGMMGQRLDKKASSAPPNYLPRVGPFADHALVDANTLPNMGAADVVAFDYNYFVVSRANPLLRKTIDLNGTFAAVLPDPRTGSRAMFTYADTVNIGPGQGFGSFGTGYPPFPDGTTYNGSDGSSDEVTWQGGQGGSGGSGGGGGAADSAGASPVNGGAGSGAGTNGANGQASPFATVVGLGGVGKGAADLAGDTYTTAVGGASSDGITPTQPGCGAGGSGGSSIGGAQTAVGGAGAGGSYVGIVCWHFGGTGPDQNQGIFAQGGNGGNDDGEGNSTEAGAGGGAVIELFCADYDGSAAPFVEGGVGNQGTPASSGFFFLYELNAAGVIINIHTDPTVTFNNL